MVLRRTPDTGFESDVDIELPNVHHVKLKPSEIPEGHAQCRECFRLRPKDEFLRHDPNLCKHCAADYQNRRYARDGRKDFLARHAESRRLQVRPLRLAYLYALLSAQPCPCCTRSYDGEQMTVWYPKASRPKKSPNEKAQSAHTEESIKSVADQGYIVCRTCDKGLKSGKVILPATARRGCDVVSMDRATLGKSLTHASLS